MAFRLGCMLNRHLPRADEARWNGITYVGVCKSCATPIHRERKGVWHRHKDGAEVRSAVADYRR